jgi:hypothetical protein
VRKSPNQSTHTQAHEPRGELIAVDVGLDFSASRTAMLATALLIFGAAVQNPALTLRREQQTALVAASPPPPVPIAKSAGDVVRTTVGSFFTIGSFGFALTAFQESVKRAGVAGRAKARVPYFVCMASLNQAQRWGRVSAGFSGGRALGQWLRGMDDSTCAMLGSICGGICAAPNVGSIPSSVATFAAFGYFIESFAPKSDAAADPQKQLTQAREQRAKLQKQLDAVDGEIRRLQAA